MEREKVLGPELFLGLQQTMRVMGIAVTAVEEFVTKCRLGSLWGKAALTNPSGQTPCLTPHLHFLGEFALFGCGCQMRAKREFSPIRVGKIVGAGVGILSDFIAFTA